MMDLRDTTSLVPVTTNKERNVDFSQKAGLLLLYTRCGADYILIGIRENDEDGGDYYLVEYINGIIDIASRIVRQWAGHIAHRTDGR